MPFLAAAMFFVSCKKDTIPTNNPVPVVTGPDLIFYGVTSAGQLAKYNAMNPGTAISSVAISGLHAGESILAVDFRPATGELYGIGSSSSLYIINLSAGNARMVGTGHLRLH